MPYVERDKDGVLVGIFDKNMPSIIDWFLEDDDPELVAFIAANPKNENYRIGKSTPWRRMTDDEAIKASGAIKQQSVKNQMIYDAASYIDTSDELFGTLKALLTSLFSAARADELLAREE